MAIQLLLAQVREREPRLGCSSKSLYGGVYSSFQDPFMPPCDYAHPVEGGISPLDQRLGAKRATDRRGAGHCPIISTLGERTTAACDIWGPLDLLQPAVSRHSIGYAAGRRLASGGRRFRRGTKTVFIDTGDLDGPERMVVDPDKLLQLKQGIEEERDRVAEWILRHARQLGDVKSPGGDPCSEDAIAVVSENGGIAMAKGAAYAARLDAVIDKMRESALAYGLIEDTAVTTFRQGPA
jgi:hypothetical protein